AFANRNDVYHDWAVGVAKEVKEPLLTCEAVLAEAAFHLRSVPTVAAMVEHQLVALSFDLRKHLREIAALANRYSERTPDLADLCLVRMSELHPRHSVITVDVRDFRVFRKNKREVIPLICPPGT